ncbi:hypothetical protein LTS18_015086 [Coniosporium uncinatum]|uniref:Uncharacterized protein n=1 Tax=Coniosporium uncinatum TaxID=93489 RepID=A0ACC3D8E9_9PEZI|nr:hypothetical protein LTS18_015086 [Coniosporium uncinatum]
MQNMEPGIRPSMRAWLYTSANGGLENSLELSETAACPPKDLLKGQILVEVLSMSLNPVDYKIPEMGPLSKALISTPASPGLDYTGRVLATDSTNDRLSIGQHVFGRIAGPTRFGTLGQIVQAPQSGCVPLPAGVDPDQAAAVGTAGLTAYQCIVPNLSPGGVVEGAGSGKRVFINGGSGGTGTWGIQIAKVLGAHVTTSCSGANAALCKELGADEVIDYKSTDVAQALAEKGMVFDLVVDNVGTPEDLYKASEAFLRPEGKFVQVGATPSMASVKSMATRALLPSFMGGGKRKFQFVSMSNDYEQFAQMGRWLSEGKIKAVIDEVFDFEDAPRAIEKLKSGRARGNIVVHVTPEKKGKGVA